MPLRLPIIVVLGHVDSGKTSLLDKIRKTSIAKKEAGGITQHIGATEIPIDVVKEISKQLLYLFNFNLKIPGLLFIDTPGHEVFTNLRRRGGSVADLAVIVIDVMEGFKPQTYEAIEICKQFKVPFVVALNKIDRIPGWYTKPNKSFLESIKSQTNKVIVFLEERLYDVVGKLYELGFDSERFDRIKDFRKQVAIIPVSAKTGEGIPELLLIISGLVQKFLEKRLEIDPNSPGKGIILEKKKVKGFGTVLDVILYEGSFVVGEEVAFLTSYGIKTTQIKILLKPRPLEELRERKTRFIRVDKIHAAAGIRVVGKDIDDAIPGSPIVSARQGISKEIEEFFKEELKDIIFENDKVGIIIKADTLGSLEALVRIIKDKNIPIAKADIGNITKEDIVKALSIRENSKEYAVIIGFNVEIDKQAEGLAKSSKINIILNNVIYKLIEDVEKYIESTVIMGSLSELENLPKPVKFVILKDHIFRRSNPAIVGVEVLSGELTPGIYLINQDGKIVGKVKSIQKDNKSISIAKKGDKVAISIEKAMVGRHINEGDILYTYITEDEFREYKKLKDKISEDYRQILRDIAKIMRKHNPSWGI